MIWRINSFTGILHNYWFTGKLLLKDSSQTTKRRFLLLFNTSSSIPDTNLKIKKKYASLDFFKNQIFLKIDHFVHVTEGLNTYKLHIKPQDTSIEILEEWNGTVIRYNYLVKLVEIVWSQYRHYLNLTKRKETFFP